MAVGQVGWDGGYGRNLKCKVHPPGWVVA